MSNHYIVRVHLNYIGGDSSGWLVLVPKEKAEIFDSETEAIQTANNFTRESNWVVETVFGEASSINEQILS